MSDIVSEINRRGLYENPKDLREELTLAEDWLALANLAIQKHDPEIDFTKVKRTYQIEKGKYNKEKKEQLIYALLF